MFTSTEMVAKHLELVFKNSPEETIEDIGDVKWIIFSDHHRGQMDGADDFKACKHIYHAALGYYLAAGYNLILLGDVEELWECFPNKILKKYKDTYQLEKKFVDAGRYLRFWGNHDDIWSWRDRVKTQLRKYIGDAEVFEGKRFKIHHKGKEVTLFLVHGHQGTYDSDIYKGVSRFFVRFFWRNIQRVTRIRSDRPVKNFTLRKRDEKAMYSWVSKKENVIMINGHTHRPIFGSEVLEDELVKGIAELQGSSGKQLAPDENRRLRERLYETSARLEWVRSKSNGEDSGLPVNSTPCFFNSGACCFSDGDVTGIEIAEGEIRLVRWPDDEGNPLRKILKSEKLAGIFDKL
ncbi:MAG: hypothetical protein GY765_33790 [bacterium]|nr:hypothetical protein [bacterium]